MKKLIIYGFSLLISFYTQAQVEDLHFTRVSPPGGLNFQHIHNITQDKEGNIWMGSNQGVYRYNSSGFIRYHHNPTDMGSLRSDIVNQLLVDKHNKIWVANNSGLDIFDNANQKFIHFNYASNGVKTVNRPIYSIGIDGQNNIWIADSRGLGCIDTVKHEVSYIDAEAFDTIPYLIYFDKENKGWVGTNSGSIYQFNSNNKKTDKIIDGPGSNPRVIYVENDSIYVGYQSHGARLYNTDGQLMRHFEYNQEPKWDIKNVSVRSILRDNVGNLWIASYSGLFVERDGELHRINSENQDAIPNKSFYSVFQDRSGGLWFGTWSGGLIYYNVAANNFMHFSHTQTSGSLSDNIISSFVELDDGSMYIGTEVGGLNKYWPQTEKCEKIRLGNTDEIINIKALSIDKDGTVWVGTYRHKLWYQKKGSDTFVQMNPKNHPSFPSQIEHVYAIAPCKQGIWIGTFGNGVYFYDFKKNSFTSFNNMNISEEVQLTRFVRTLHVDSEDGLWVGSNSGVSRFYPDEASQVWNETFHDPLGHVYYIHQMDNNEVWVGAKATGIHRYKYKEKSIANLGTDSLFLGKDVYGFVADQDKNVWITTNTGLYFYDTLNHNLRQFNEIDGIQGNQFNPQSIFKDDKNKLYFGGTNGFTVVDPNKLKTNLRPPKVILNWLSVNNKHKLYPEFNTAKDSYNPLKFGYNKTSFRVTFAADNYLLAGKNRYKYRLVGIYDEWIDNETDNQAVFTSIPSGDYIFEVKAANNDGIWNQNPTTLPVSIKLPWWRTTLAYLIYLAIFAAIWRTIYNARRDRMALRKSLLVLKIKQEQEEQLHEAKLKFFTNVSHEMRTPLTLISGPLNSVISKETLSQSALQKLKLIQQNTTRLLTLMNQVLDFRKLEKGSNKILLSQIDLRELLQQCIGFFAEEANEKGIRYTLTQPLDFTVQGDREKLDKIFINLLSNAFKSVKQNGFIDVKVENKSVLGDLSYQHHIKMGQLPEEEYVQISIIDSGLGFDEKMQDTMFKRFEKGYGNEIGTGIGLSICKDYVLLHHGQITASGTPGKGACFTVTLPLSQNEQWIPQQPPSPLHDDCKEVKSLEESKPLVHRNEEGVPYRILVVEDNDEMRRFLIDILSTYYFVDEAPDGAQAIAQLNNEAYDLVLSDVMMPEIDGFDLCNKIKSTIELSHIPVVLLTALSSDANEIKGLTTGADDYITKPFSENLLISRLSNLLKQREDLKLAFQNSFIHDQNVQSQGKLENYFLDKVSDIIKANVSNVDFSVETMSSEVGMSRGHLHRKLKQLTNYSPNEYIRLIRLRDAAKLLKEGNYNVEEIVFMVGFNSPSYFTKCFKEQYDKTPKQYMQDHIPR